LPAAHGWHAVWAVLGLKEPAAHAPHVAEEVAASAVELVPVPHDVHPSVPAWSLYAPAEQALQGPPSEPV
jgi:hypothetical protein